MTRLLRSEDEEPVTDRARSARWKIEAVLTAWFALGTLTTVVVPSWIEAIGLEPDRGDGSAEWAIVVALGVAALASGALARSHHAGRSRRPASGAGARP